MQPVTEGEVCPDCNDFGAFLYDGHWVACICEAGRVRCLVKGSELPIDPNNSSIAPELEDLDAVYSRVLASGTFTTVKTLSAENRIRDWLEVGDGDRKSSTG